MSKIYYTSSKIIISMSSNLAYLVYQAMTSNLQSVSFYAVDTNNQQHPFKVLVPATNSYYYFDDSEAVYTATGFYITVNGTTILSVALNNVQKTANTTLIIALTLNISISLPGSLACLVTQAIQGIFAGVLVNLGCSITANYTITNEQTNQQTQGSITLSLSLVNDSEFQATGSIQYSQYEEVSVSQIMMSCSYGNVQANLLQSVLNSGECTNSSGCTYTITVTFSS